MKIDRNITKKSSLLQYFLIAGFILMTIPFVDILYLTKIMPYQPKHLIFINYSDQPLFISISDLPVEILPKQTLPILYNHPVYNIKISIRNQKGDIVKYFEEKVSRETGYGVYLLSTDNTNKCFVSTEITELVYYTYVSSPISDAMAKWKPKTKSTITYQDVLESYLNDANYLPDYNIIRGTPTDHVYVNNYLWDKYTLFPGEYNRQKLPRRLTDDSIRINIFMPVNCDELTDPVRIKKEAITKLIEQ